MYGKQTYVIIIYKTIMYINRCTINNILYLLGSLSAVSTVVTMIHLGYVASLAAFLAPLVLESAVIWRMFASTTVTWSCPLLRVLVDDIICVKQCCPL